jgi:predicted phage terminase large subunit-like protein
MNAPADIAAALQRTHLRYFLLKVFETLHPGEPPLERSWYLDAICHALEEVHSGSKPRLVITVPPRHLKSVTASVAFVAWLLGHHPSMTIMVASYSQDLARYHSGLCRDVMETAWYRRLFPNTRISNGGNRAHEFVTTRGGSRKAVSVGGSATGFGADLIIIDDCMKADEARSQAVRDEVKGWFENTLMTRLNDKRHSKIISIQQRLHEDDLPAHLLDKDYEHLNLPSIAEKDEFVAIGKGRVHRRCVGDLLNPSREDQKVLDQLRKDLGPAVFSAQYQQDPVAPEGNLLRMEWFGTYDFEPDRNIFQKVVQSWDTGMSSQPSSDYSVCTTWGFRENKWHLLDVLRQRLDYPDLKNAVLRLRRQWQADRIIIEDACSGKSLWQEFLTHRQFRPVMWPATDSKEERFVGTLGEIEAGNILLPVEAPWLPAFRSELRAFPNGRHDDQVDSMSQFILWQLRHWAWTLSEIDSQGRPVRPLRMNRRPY